MTANENLLAAIQERLIFLRKEKFKTATEFGNVANVNERRNELYLVDFQISSLLRIAIALGVELEDLVTPEMKKKYAEELEREERDRENRGE